MADDAVLVHHARLRATELTRQVAPVSGRRKDDVYDARNVAAGKVAVVHLESVESDPADVGLARATSRDPTNDIASAIDLVAWLSGRTGQDRLSMLALRAAGFTLEETGEKRASRRARCSRGAGSSGSSWPSGWA